MRYLSLGLGATPFACGCEQCGWTAACVAVAAVVAIGVFVALSVVRELRLLASLRPSAGVLEARRMR